MFHCGQHRHGGGHPDPAPRRAVQAFADVAQIPDQLLDRHRLPAGFGLPGQAFVADDDALHRVKGVRQPDGLVHLGPGAVGIGRIVVVQGADIDAHKKLQVRKAAVAEGYDLVQAVVQAEGPHVPEPRRGNGAEVRHDLLGRQMGGEIRALSHAVKRAVVHTDESGLQAKRRRGGEQAGQRRPEGEHPAEMSRMRCHTISAGTASSAG